MRLGTVALFVAVGLLYGALGLAGFVWDDIPLIVENRITGDLANVPLFFLEDLWASSGVSGGHASGYYRPLMLLSLAVDRALWGLSPAGHHLHSVAWHLAASGVLLVLLRRLVPPLPALLGTGVFALHPLPNKEGFRWRRRSSCSSLRTGHAAGCRPLWLSPRPLPLLSFFLVILLELLHEGCRAPHPGPEAPGGQRVFRQPAVSW